MSDGESCFLFLGTLTIDVPHFEARGGQGIHVWRLDSESGVLTPLSVCGGIENPNYLAFDPARGLLYAASEVMDWPQGKVTRLRFDPATRRLAPLESQPSLGHLTCFIALSASGRHVLAANYSMLPPGSEPDRAFAVLPAGVAGLAPASAAIRRAGLGADAVRQERSHPHCLIMLPDGRLAGTDLGTDEILLHDFDEASGAMSPEPMAVIALPPGSGPRHLVSNRAGTRLYVVNELASTVGVLQAQGAGFALAGLAPILGESMRVAESTAAAIVLSPSERFLYASHRKPDLVSLLHVQADGGLRLAGTWPSGGRTPRSMALTPDGRFLLVGNQDSGTLSVFAANPENGALQHVHDAAVAAPMCVLAVSGRA